MLYIKTFISESKIHGLGLFADQDIFKGTLLGEFIFGMDISLSEEEYFKLEPRFKEFFDSYGWKDKLSGKYMLNVDNTRFMNHSESPNIYHDKYQILAARDIQKGEELLDNYSDFDDGLALNHINQWN